MRSVREGARAAGILSSVQKRRGGRNDMQNAQRKPAHPVQQEGRTIRKRRQQSGENAGAQAPQRYVQ